VSVKLAIMAIVHEPLGKRRGMPTHTNSQHSDQVMETIFVGAALKHVSAEIMEKDVPVRTRHMRSIDDLLIHVEDHDVECAVIDQSLPTESRGLKLVLLAGIKKVRHLIVVASQNSQADIVSIDGVHKVLASPVSHEQIIAAVLEQTQQAASKTIAATGRTVSALETLPENAALQTEIGFANFRHAISDIAGTRHKLTQCNLSSLSNRLQTRPVMATVACVFACLSTVAALSLVSDSSVLLAESAGQQATAQRSIVAPDKTTTRARLAKRAHLAKRALGQTVSALEAAELSRREAASRLQGSLRTIDLEILQQRRLRQNLSAHITRLNAIVFDLKSAHSKNSSVQTGRSGFLNAHKRLAEVKIELALQELELSKIENVLSNLDFLKSEISPPATDALKLADIRVRTH